MRYSVLGTTEAWDGDTAVPLGGGRLRALLTALLAHADRPVPADGLIQEVWGTEPPGDATGALQALVARLRRTLGRDAVTAEPGGGYCLRTEGPDALDLRVFEALLREGGQALRDGAPDRARSALARALALWRGAAFADLPDPAAYAARPEAQRLTALRLRAEADLALGRAADALPALREAVAEHPLDEAFRAQMIRALRAEGRTADALVAYDEARTVLAETLGADPGPELRALHAELLRQDRAPLPRARAAEQAAPPAPAPRRSNIRARLTSFVGREADLRDLRADLSAARLVTLTGPGGSGKTRLAQEAADRADAPGGGATPGHPGAPDGLGGPGHPGGPAYPDGVWLVELASLDDPAGIAHAVLNAVGRRDTLITTPPALVEDPAARLLEHCAHRRLLLVLDNCEHLIGAAARLAADLLAHCPGVTVLATSREPLGVPGEVVRPVEPLPQPTAHALFAERAAAVRAGAADDAEAVAEICRRLDGLPLAIELAAARLRALSARQIADRLDDRFRLLTGGSRTLLPRQQTLRAVVDWSWELLDEAERAALSALSVFAGGCTLAAAEAVCGPDVPAVVAQLVDKSLVVADHDRPGGTRYRLLETIHEYASARRAERPREAARAAARHTAYVRELAATADSHLRSAEQLRWMDVLEAELDNVRAALQRTVAAGAEEDAAAIALSMSWFWWLRNYRDEAGDWLDRIVLLDPSARATAPHRAPGSAPDGPADRTPGPAPDPGLDRAPHAAPGRAPDLGHDRTPDPARNGSPDAAPDRAPGPDDPLRRLRVDVRMLAFFVRSDRASEAHWYSQEAQAEAALLVEAYRRGGPAAARFPGLLWPFVLYVLDGAVDLTAHTDAAVDNARVYGGDWEVAVALMFRAHIMVDSPGALERADADLAELREIGERLQDRWIRAQLHGASAEIATLRCQYDLARADFEAALRLGRELGAESEGAFLLGRLAELAYRSGDSGTARKLCAQAEEEAERYAVWDARTYIRYMKAMLLLHEGDVAAAREMADLAHGHIADGTPPPMFHVLVASLRARITAAEGDPRGALAALAEACRRAVEVRSTDVVVAAQLDAAAEVLSGLGEAPGALTLSAAAEAVRGALPRTVPEQEADAAVRARAAAVLGAREQAEARAAGAGVDRAAAVALLSAVAAGADGSGTGSSPGPWPAPGKGPGADRPPDGGRPGAADRRE